MLQALPQTCPSYNVMPTGHTVVIYLFVWCQIVFLNYVLFFTIVTDTKLLIDFTDCLVRALKFVLKIFWILFLLIWKYFEADCGNCDQWL